MANDFSLSVDNGDISGSMPGVGGFNPGALQSLLRWKMNMAEQMQKAQLAQEREKLRMMQQSGRGRRPMSGGGMMPGEGRGAPPSSQLHPSRAGGPDFYQIAGEMGNVQPANYRYNTADQARSLAPWMRAIGADRAHAGMMQTGQLLSRGGGDSPGMVDRQRMMGVLQQLASTQGEGSGRETGGGIPEDGWYYLHQDEEVVPAPKTIREIMEGRFRPDPNAPEGRSYETGTGNLGLGSAPPGPGHWEALGRGLYPFQQQEPSPEAEHLGIMDIIGQSLKDMMPEPPAFSSPGEELREMIGNPDVHPQEALDRTARERERLSRKAGPRPSQEDNGPYGGKMTESRGAAGERSFTLEGSEQDRSKPMYESSVQINGQDPQTAHQMGEINRFRDAAASHATMAQSLLDYAEKRPNSPAAERLREMAADRMKMAKEMEGIAQTRQKQLDEMAARMGEQEAQVVASQIEAAGRQGAAQTQAGASQQRGLMQQQEALWKALADMAGYDSENMDPEQQEAMRAQVFSWLAMMAGLQEGLGAGFPGE